MSTNYVKIGNIIKPYGVTGGVRVQIDEHFEDEYTEKKHFFIFINGNYVPFFVENIDNTNIPSIKFEEIDTPEHASKISQKDLFLRESEIASLTYKNERSKIELEGFTLWNKKEQIGVVLNIKIFPQQVMAEVATDNRIVLIPLVESWIEKINYKSKILVMQLPDGLLNL